MMSHEKLDVYQASIEFFAVVLKIRDEVPRGHGDLLDQFLRASMSIPLNIAEAVGKNSKPDMKRFLAIARGSSMECAAIVDVGLKLQIIQIKDAQQAKLLLHRIASMLSKMIVSTTITTTQTRTTTLTPTINRPPPRPGLT